MKKILMISILLLSGAFIFNACEEEKDYDFASYEPVVFSAKGNTAPMQGRHYEYTAEIRGGSTYNWSTAKSANVVEGVTESNWMVYINFPDIISTSDEPEVVTVTETAYSGKVSNEYTITVDTVAPFKALAIEGSDIVNGGFVSNYGVSPSKQDKIYSTYAWECDKGTLTQDSEEPWKISIAFENEDVGTAELILTETTTTGFEDKDTLEIVVNAYCELENGLEDLVGVWQGTDAATYYTTGESQVESELIDDKIVLTGLGLDWMINFWGEEVIDGGTIEIEVNMDGTIEIPEQYYITTVYDGDEQDPYSVRGEGRWDNCGAYPTLTLEYEMNNYDIDWGAWTYENGYSNTPHFVATLTLDPAGKVMNIETKSTFDLNNKPRF